MLSKFAYVPANPTIPPDIGIHLFPSADRASDAKIL